ncbi:glutamate dehydrogenase (NADP) [Staphylothermus marinus F1]|uniref:Glutamate dehydrogenase n=1 Tax=Staphylothermus marinus (strain ATCC 43588 / DSM 3639 / JCM 9404 / F1) TaxID=399550 RepID=A3DLU5_STAMF|nr:Glu/Leu/Phe/Val dehydrogenase [Staphylothermus marinus]ABN69605.1 glutamate dehydrogenase (NADP) [Staphylothermus marinus F1]
MTEIPASLYENDPTYQMAVKQLREAAQLLGLPDEIVEVLRHPERLIQVKIPVRRDNGKIEVYLGWRSQHNSALGPYKGGIRYREDVTPGEVVALSMWMTWKNSLAGIPYGGGKGGVRVNPKLLSQRELEELSRKYFAALARNVGPDVDIPAPDVYTNPQTMAWYFDEYSKIVGYNAWGVVTAKPVELGGLHARTVSTGYGTALTAREAAKRWIGGIEGKTVAIQGFGNVGQYAAKYLKEWGAIVVAVSDRSGGIYDPNGIDVEEAMKVKAETGKVTNYKKGNVKIISNEELLELDVDILIPAATENVITKANADRIKAKVISEGANGPTTPEAEEILHKKGVVIVPDILANAGGVTMSWIEWSHNRMGCWLTDEEALARLDRIMTHNFNRVFDDWQKKFSDYPMRAAAYAIAVDRVVRAMKLRGWI